MQTYVEREAGVAKKHAERCIAEKDAGWTGEPVLVGKGAIEPFVFSGADADAWISLMEMHFQKHEIEEECKVEAALDHCDFKVVSWWVARHRTSEWEVFALEVKDRYGRKHNTLGGDTWPAKPHRETISWIPMRFICLLLCLVFISPALCSRGRGLMDNGDEYPASPLQKGNQHRRPK